MITLYDAWGQQHSFDSLKQLKINADFLEGTIPDDAYDCIPDDAFVIAGDYLVDAENKIEKEWWFVNTENNHKLYVTKPKKSTIPGVEHVDTEDWKKSSLPAHAWPGGYTLVYYCRDDSSLCSGCATKVWLKMCFGEEPPPDLGEQLRIYGTYDEGSAVECDECNCEIKSSYGDPDEIEQVQIIINLEPGQDTYPTPRTYRDDIIATLTALLLHEEGEVWNVGKHEIKVTIPDPVDVLRKPVGTVRIATITRANKNLGHKIVFPDDITEDE